MHVLHVVGARPNFMKVAPVHRALATNLHTRQTIVHSGQHYDRNMSGVFFDQIGIPEPDTNLDVGSDSHALQTANIMTRFEPVLLEKNPDWVLVYGDVNSTIAAALVCSKLGVRIAHVEAGLRSFDRTMPEEINRILTDQISHLLFTPSQDGNENLEKEGIPADRIRLVGNVMIDTLIRLLPLAEAQFQRLQQQFGLHHFGLVTLHRPATVDSPDVLLPVLAALSDISRGLPIVFPMHPRTRAQLGDRIQCCTDGLKIVEPLPYLDFLALQKHATVVITDSGGIQEETTFLGVPCLTVRENTERPITVTLGTNTVIGRNSSALSEAVGKVLHGDLKKGQIPPLWDGKASERIASILHASM